MIHDFAGKFTLENDFDESFKKPICAGKGNMADNEDTNGARKSKKKTVAISEK
jgi:hypothetical protein